MTTQNVDTKRGGVGLERLVRLFRGKHETPLREIQERGMQAEHENARLIAENKALAAAAFDPTLRNEVERLKMILWHALKQNGPLRISRRDVELSQPVAFRVWLDHAAYMDVYEAEEPNKQV